MTGIVKYWLQSIVGHVNGGRVNDCLTSIGAAQLNAINLKLCINYVPIIKLRNSFYLKLKQ